MTDRMQVPTALQPMPQESKHGTIRTSITLPAVVYEALQEWADEERRATANLVNVLLEMEVRAKYPERFKQKTKLSLEGDRDE